MALPRIKFIWSASPTLPARWMLGLFGLYDRGAKRRRGLVISLRGLLAWAAALAVVGWFAAASALFLWLERRPVNFVSWTDCVLLPLRWDEVSRKRGQAYIAEGQEDFRARRWTEGMMKVRSGLARSPRDWPARLELARFFVSAGLRNHALATLADGLDHGYPGRTYLENLLATAMQGEDYDKALAACERALSLVRGGTGDARDEIWLVHQRLQILLATGRPEEVLGDPALQAPTDNLLNELAVVAFISAKRPDDALDWLRRWRERDGATAQVLRLQVRACREAGDRAGMERALEELRERAPMDPAAYIYRVVQRSMAGDATGARAALDEFVLRFSGSAENMMKIAAPLGEIGDVDLLQRCADVATEHGFAVRPYRVLLVQGFLVRGDWPRASATLEAILAEHTASLAPLDEFWNELMRRLVPATTSAADGTQRALIEFCRDRPLPLRLTKLIYDVLTRAGRYATARDIAGFAQRLYPGSKSLADAREAADERERAIQTDVAKAREAKLAEVAAPVVPLAEEPRVDAPRAGSVWVDNEAGFFAALERMAADARWSEIVDEARAVRRAQPGWLMKRDADVMRFEMKALAGLDRPLELIVALRLFLDGSNARNLDAMAVVRMLDEASRRETARLALAEILKKSPQFPPALRQQRAWQPAPPVAADGGG
ncbi:MAG TPA: hypothetical protein VGD81_09410 [Opitutaceae bacterium]